jgi:hypothetical protein
VTLQILVHVRKYLLESLYLFGHRGLFELRIQLGAAEVWAHENVSVFDLRQVLKDLLRPGGCKSRALVVSLQELTSCCLAPVNWHCGRGQVVGVLVVLYGLGYRLTLVLAYHLASHGVRAQI